MDRRQLSCFVELFFLYSVQSPNFFLFLTFLYFHVSVNFINLRFVPCHEIRSCLQCPEIILLKTDS